MNGKLKIAGTALLAALALSAVAASAASAQNKTDHITATEPWTPKVSAINPPELDATTGQEALRAGCKKVSATTTGELTTTIEEIAVTPKYENVK